MAAKRRGRPRKSVDLSDEDDPKDLDFLDNEGAVPDEILGDVEYESDGDFPDHPPEGWPQLD